MSNDARQYTTQLIEAIDNELVDKDYVLKAALGHLSDAEVHKMCLANDILFYEPEEDDHQPTHYEEMQDFMGGDDPFE